MSEAAPNSLVALVAPEYIEWMALLDPRRAPTVDSAKRLPSESEYRKLVEEVALGYYTGEQVCERFGIERAVYDELAAHPTFRRDVLTVQREQDGSDEAVRTLARRETRDAIRSLSEIVKADESIDDLKERLEAAGIEPDAVALVAMMPSVSNRIKAVEQLRHLAGLGAQTTPNGGAMVVPLQLTTNLTLEQAGGGGRYTAVAKPLGEVVDAEVVDDFSDLLG